MRRFLNSLFPVVPDDPFVATEDPKDLWLPDDMITPPALEDHSGGPPEPFYALLINPFYPKDPHASFGKHVLTPTLALTSFAGATPDLAASPAPQHLAAPSVVSAGV